MSDTAQSLRAAEKRMFTSHGLAHREHVLRLREPAMSARVLESGDERAPPVLFVHGGGAFGALWAPLAAALPGRRHVMPDRPGFGLSELVPLDGVDFRKHAVSFLASTMDALGLGTVDVVGNSMGGLWSLWLALDRPERVRSLSLLGAPAMTGGGSAPMPMRLLGKPVIGALMMKLEPPSPKQVRVLWQRMGHDPDALPAVIHDAMLAAERVPTYAPAWRALLGRVLTLRGPAPDVALADAELARLRMPVRYVWGERDTFGDPALAQRVARATNDAPLTVAGRGHLPWLDDAAACAHAITPALAPASAGRAA